MATLSTVTPSGHIPIELLQDITPAVRVSGCPHRTFPSDPERVDSQGKPRRLEWMVSQQEVEEFLRYNRPGKPPLFRVAHDLVQNAHIEAFQSQVAQIVGPLLDERVGPVRDKFRALEVVISRLQIAERRQTDLESMVVELQAVVARVAALEASLHEVSERQDKPVAAGKRPGRPRKEEGTEDLTPGTTTP